MARATWNGTVIAESEVVEEVEGTLYFPIDSVDRSCLKESATETVCGWKGTANYYTVVAGGSENPDAAWYYADPKPEAANIKGFVAFWKGVEVER